MRARGQRDTRERGGDEENVGCRSEETSEVEKRVGRVRDLRLKLYHVQVQRSGNRGGRRQAKVDDFRQVCERILCDEHKRDGT